ncbi:MAG: hypothetical protein ACK4QL_01485 [Pseudanabaenaceae cyanobacterium]
MQANLRHTLFLTAAAVIIALGIGVITARHIARPIAKLSCHWPFRPVHSG